jgi:hypothetical protein
MEPHVFADRVFVKISPKKTFKNPSADYPKFKSEATWQQQINAVDLAVRSHGRAIAE